MPVDYAMRSRRRKANLHRSEVNNVRTMELSGGVVHDKNAPCSFVVSQAPFLVQRIRATPRPYAMICQFIGGMHPVQNI